MSTFAPILALALLASAGSAYKYGKEFEAKAKIAKDAEVLARTNLEAAEIALAEVGALSESKSGDLQGRNLELAHGVATLMALAKGNGIKVGAIGSASLGNSGAKSIESIFTSVPMTDGKLHRTDVLMKANYQSYDGFRNFFDEIRKRGMAVQSVTVRNSYFEATVRFMGT